MALIAQNTFSLKRLAKDEFNLILSSDTIAIPATADGVADLTNAEFSARVTKGGKELFPNFDTIAGGRNLLRDSAVEHEKITIDTGAPSSVAWTPSLTFEPNTEYTLSFDFKCDSGINAANYNYLWASDGLGNTSIGAIAVISDGEWHRFVHKFSFTQQRAGYVRIAFDGRIPAQVTSGVTCYVKNGKISIADDVWTPAPEEILRDAIITTNNCSAVVVEDKIKITTLTPGKNSGYIDLTVTYGAGFTATKRFTWARAKDGAAGKSITKVDVYYAQSTSNATAPTSGWATTAPTWENGKYIWSKTITTYSDGTTTETTPVCITGGTGTGIESITEEYYLSTSKTAQSGGSWVTTPPAWSYGKYMWTRSKIVYKNPTSTVWTTPVCDSSWEAVNDLQVGTRNYIAKKYLRDWSQINSNITQEGSDADGDYLAIEQWLLYQYIGSSSEYKDVFLDKIKYKANTQYAFKVRWKLLGEQTGRGLVFRMYYTDGTYGDVGLAMNQTTIIEQSIITTAGKTLQKIAPHLGTNTYRSLIYDIQLTEGNRQTSDYLVAPEDIQDAIDNIEVGGVNLVKNGNFMAGLNDWNLNYNQATEQPPTTTIIRASEQLPKGALSAIRITTNADLQGVWQNFYDKQTLELGRTYTLSFIAKKDGAGDLSLIAGHENNLNSIEITTEWLRYRFTFKPTVHKNFIFYLFNAGTFYITNIQLESGTKATDFKNGYLEEAIQGSTEINGGLTLANIIGAKDESGVVRSYMSGLASNPTAFAAGVENFGEINETKGTDLRHDGSGHVAFGKLWWNILGQLFFGETTAGETLAISTDAIPSLADMQRKERYELPEYGENITIDFGDPANVGRVSELWINYVQEFTLENDGTVSIDAGFNYSWGAGLAGFGADGRVWLQKQNGAVWQDIDIAFGEYEQREYSCVYYAFNRSLSRGKYRILMVADCGGEQQTGSNATVTLNKFCLINYKLNVKKLVLGIDGIALFDSMSDNMLRLSLKDSIPFRYKGAMDIPGVLLAGRGASGGGASALLGAKKHASLNVVKIAAGTYTVYHSIGHTDYSVQVTSMVAQRTVYWANPLSDRFTVYIYNGSTLTDTNFSFAVFGEN